ncbi:hypothetical protein B0I35DRAFT_405471 [Stachybotrys elegans]|uniref:Phospholipase n=1 Tax=Stachybotrys elegans TaxID=80388 RepID=A0A8K0T0F7_9HYPO|nr:hypothetical protein B0I35DRAFT_405471 [Stachybotrys elegans]
MASNQQEDDPASSRAATAHDEARSNPASNMPDRPDNPIPETQVRDYFVGSAAHQPEAPAIAITSPPAQTQSSAQPISTEPRVVIPEQSSNQQTGPDDSPVPGRRSVQFGRVDLVDTSPVDLETPTKSRGNSFMSKLKALTTSTPSSPIPKSPLTPSAPAWPDIQTSSNPPVALTVGPRVPDTLVEEQSDADADAEETADEANIPGAESSKKKKKRRMRRAKKDEEEVPVSTLQALGLGAASRKVVRRRASMPDTRHQRGLSEGDVQDPPPNRHFRRGSSWMTSSMKPPGEDADEPESSALAGRRHGHVRRISVFGGGGVSDGDAMTPKRPFFGGERGSTFGTNRWEKVKNTLKLLRQKKEDRFDYLKSAELMAELRAGAPAVLMLASMIQRDEHGNKRIPVLLEQLKLRIQDSAPMPDDDSQRHWIFTIELEYGSGPSRMNWTVIRTIRDIYNLHFRYRFAINNEKYLPGRLDLGARLKQPKFPYSAFPYLRRARNKEDESEEEEQPSAGGEDTVGEPGTDNVLSDLEPPHHHARKRSRNNILMGMSRRSTGMTDNAEAMSADGTGAIDAGTRRQRYVDKQRRILEKYLSEMIRWLMFRADSNRLCRFLELSALGVRLAAEGSYHGKEGYLHIQSSKGLDFRRVLTPNKIIARHSRKWFLVRQSYIVCVESPENMNIYDVYLVDSKFAIVSKRNVLKQISSKDENAEIDLGAADSGVGKHHTLALHTSERKVRLFSRNQSVMRQFEESIGEMLRQTPWHLENRFGSFAPVRSGVFAQWLVDGRDYMWNVSRAINMARDVIYIHDWWLSPELYMRRPAAISQKWRLDRLLQKKAREGVKIFVIIYRNVEAAVPIDSEYTKFSLLNLHPNIFVQRSPNQFKKNQFFFAHHEKICVVDHDVAFVGGVDLCFGRWDCPQHPIVDDKPTGFEVSETPKDAEHCQLFPGKDYSNPRVQDFFRLNEPYEEMYDRSKVPRMPWHDIAMQVVGQPARDLTRHFVQRWNYLRRGRKPTRPLPFLLPPPDAKMEELEALGLTGTCEVQILRSASTWSLGTEDTECSIQTAYVKMIEDSEHFIYIENQFFISSTEVYNTRITNRIGDALVDRIIRAHNNHEDWRCVVLIPLMPGFQNTVDEQEGTSVRLILMCQFRSICRGEQSIFGRLRAADIEPEDYISFYSLRQWGVMSNEALVTEQLYIHSKAIIADDRIALIGSANINERSMVGYRDSECAAIVRDTDMIESTMAGKPYRVSRFAHTLRLRLMREHLGLDVDELLEQERQQDIEREEFEKEMSGIYADEGNSAEPEHPPEPPRVPSFNHGLDIDGAKALEQHSSSSSSSSSNLPEIDPRVTGNKTHELDVSGYGPDQWKTAEKSGLDEGRDSVIVNGREVLVHNIDNEGKGTLDLPRMSQIASIASDSREQVVHEQEANLLPPTPSMERRTTEQLGLPRLVQLPSLPIGDDTDIGGPPVYIDAASGLPTVGAFHPMAADIKPANIDADCMRDPIHPDFIDEVWNRVAINNTKLYRRVFRCMPDSEVSTWADYREYMDYNERFRASMEGRNRSEEADPRSDAGHHHTSNVAAAGIGAPGPDALAHAAANEAEKPLHKVAEKLPAHHGGEARDGAAGELNEKQSFHDDGAANTRPIQLGPEDASSAPGGQQVPKTITLTEAREGGVFPALDGAQTKFLDPQSARSRETTPVPPTTGGSVRRRRRATTKGSRREFSIHDMPSRSDAEELLRMVQGNIVQFPYDWLLTEELNGNWGYQVDGVAPLAIYN